MATPQSLHTTRPPKIDTVDPTPNRTNNNEDANAVLLLVIIAALIVAGVAYAWYYNAYYAPTPANVNATTAAAPSGNAVPAGNTGATSDVTTVNPGSAATAPANNANTSGQ